MTVTKVEGLKAEMNAARVARDDARSSVGVLEYEVIEANAYVTEYPDEVEYWRDEVTYRLNIAKDIYKAAEAAYEVAEVAYRKADQAHTDWVEEMTYAACEVDDGELQ